MNVLRGHRRYLGDGVFVELDSLDRIVLTTEDGRRVTNRIYLGLREYSELLFWHSALSLERLREEAEEEDLREEAEEEDRAAPDA